MPEGECKLCGSVGELKLSHFIPSFVGKWVKSTSATGFIRFNRNVNQRAQDLAKEYWLCGSCEQLFSRWEREFAIKLFHPFVKEEADTVAYGDWLAKFCASISWRTLSYLRSLNARADPVRNAMEEKILSELSAFILGDANNLGIYEQHIFPLDPVESTNTEAPPNINRYFLRSMHMDVLENSKKEIMIYTKLPRFIILGLSGHSQSKKMRSSRVSINGGKIFPQSYFWPDGFAQYLFSKAEEITSLHRSISPAQRALIDNTLKKMPERAASSDTIKAFRHDLEMFGSVVFSPKNLDDSK